MARFITESGFSTIGKVVLEGLMPIGEAIGPLGFIEMNIPLTAILGDTGQHISYMVGLDYKKNVPLILKRINELEAEKKALKLKNEPKNDQPLTLKGIFQYLFPTTAIRWLWNKLSQHKDM